LQTPHAIRNRRSAISDVHHVVRKRHTRPVASDNAEISGDIGDLERSISGCSGDLAGPIVEAHLAHLLLCAATLDFPRLVSGFLFGRSPQASASGEPQIPVRTNPKTIYASAPVRGRKGEGVTECVRGREGGR